MLLSGRNLEPGTQSPVSFPPLEMNTKDYSRSTSTAAAAAAHVAMKLRSRWYFLVIHRAGILDFDLRCHGNAAPAEKEMAF